MIKFKDWVLQKESVVDDVKRDIASKSSVPGQNPALAAKAKIDAETKKAVLPGSKTSLKDTISLVGAKHQTDVQAGKIDDKTPNV